MKSAQPQNQTLTGRNQTGPRTPEGKIRSSLNALKTGKHSSLPAGLDGLDEARQFKSFHAKLEQEHSPEGQLEGFILLQIAMCMIRQCRLWSAESEAAPGSTEAAALTKQAAALTKELDGAIARLSKLQNARKHAIAAAAMRARKEKMFG